MTDTTNLVILLWFLAVVSMLAHILAYGLGLAIAGVLWWVALVSLVCFNGVVVKRYGVAA